MPAQDIYHIQVRNALIKDGWIITHDPLRLTWGDKHLYVDLGIGRFLSSEGRNASCILLSRRTCCETSSRNRWANCCSSIIWRRSSGLIRKRRSLSNGYPRKVSTDRGDD